MENLGERINKYRTASGLSQLELSELLEVSRQSISKWETDVAVPELSKLVKMAEIFGITLDELVLGKEPEVSEEVISSRPEPTPAPVKEERHFSKVKHGMGFMFLGVGILLSFFILRFAGVLSAIVVFIPFGLSAFFCLRQFRRAALWCVDTWYVWIVSYFNYATGINWNPPLVELIRLPDESINIGRITLSFVFFFSLVILIFVHVLSYRKAVFGFSRKKNIILAVITAIALPTKSLVGWLFHVFCLNVLANGDEQYYVQNILIKYHWLISATGFLVEFAFIAAFTACLVPTFYWALGAIKRKKENK